MNDQPDDGAVRTGGAPPDFTLTVSFTSEHGIARAEASLTTPDDHLGRMITVKTSGVMHDAYEHDLALAGSPRLGYKSADGALSSALRRLTDDIARAWARYAAQHGPGVR